MSAGLINSGKMVEIVTSAPAKVILFGEHSVVYGAPAVAASINRRTTVKLRTTTHKKLQLNFLNINLSFPLPLKELELKTDNTPQQQQSLQCVRLIYDALSEEAKQQGIVVEISSDFPVGAGLGSSAGFALSLSAAFLSFDLLLQGKSPYLTKDSNISEMSNELLESVKLLSHKCEEVFHGKPSGIDTSTCLLGGVIQFQKGRVAQKIADSLPFKIAIVDTKVARNTAKVVSEVSELRQRLEVVTNGIYDTMKSVAEFAIAEIKRSSTDLASLLDLVRINQGLLYALGVSHPVLDLIGVAVADLKVAFKLTGAGRGGNALIFIPPDVPADHVSVALEKYGYSASIVNVGAEGLTLSVNYV